MKDGYFSPKLSKLKVGDLVEVNGPFGKFKIDEKKIADSKFVFIASGTGVAPFRSMVRTYPDLDYTLIHGVRYGSEAYDKEEYAAERHVLCTTGDKTGQVHGRLTKYVITSYSIHYTKLYEVGSGLPVYSAQPALLGETGTPGRRSHLPPSRLP